MTRIEVTTEDLSADATAWRAWRSALAKAASAADALPGMTADRDWSLLPAAQDARDGLNRSLRLLSVFLEDGATACGTVATALTTSARAYSTAEADVLAAAPKG